MSTVWFMDRDVALQLVKIDRALAISSTAFEKAPRLLLTMTAMTLNVCLLAFLPVFCSIVWKSGVVHRNFRLQLCSFAFYCSLGVVSRFYIFYTQYTRLSDEQVLFLFIPAQFARLAANVFAENLIACFAMERSIATHFWSWYEKGSPSTIIVFILTECINVSVAATNVYLKYNGSMDNVFIHNMIVASIGFSGFWAIYRRNLRMLERMKSGATVGSYSVAHTFQVRENIEILKYMAWMSRGWIVSTISAFTFYGYYSFGPAGYDANRALSYCMFEICLALHFLAFYALTITGNKHIIKQFLELSITRAVMSRFKVKKEKKPTIDLQSETDHYFTHFNNSWR